MGIINLQEDNSLIRELTDRRVVESLPFAAIASSILHCRAW